jgi:sulfonate transport system permease protein
MRATRKKSTEIVMAIIKRLTSFFGRRYHGMITLVVLVVIWTAASRLHLVSPETLPAPDTVLATFIKQAGSGLLGKSLWKSMGRILQGFCIGSVAGFLLGAAMGVSLSAERLMAPLINALRQVPIIGWIPLIIVWCGIADGSKIAFIAVGAFFPMVINTFEGIRSVPSGYLEVARVFQFGKGKLLTKIVLPGALPAIATGIRLSLGTSWMLVVWSEINTRSDFGIGEMLWSARGGRKMDLVIVCILVIGAVAFLINELFGHLEAYLQRWKRTAQ